MGEKKKNTMLPSADTKNGRGGFLKTTIKTWLYILNFNMIYKPKMFKKKVCAV